MLQNTWCNLHTYGQAARLWLELACHQALNQKKRILHTASCHALASRMSEDHACGAVRGGGNPDAISGTLVCMSLRSFCTSRIHGRQAPLCVSARTAWMVDNGARMRRPRYRSRRLCSKQSMDGTPRSAQTVASSCSVLPNRGSPKMRRTTRMYAVFRRPRARAHGVHM